MKNLNSTLLPQEIQFKGAILVGAIALSWVGNAVAQEDSNPHLINSQGSRIEEISPVMRTTPQILENPEDGESFQFQGSFTHIFYKENSDTSSFLDEVDLSVKETEDSDGINGCLATYTDKVSKMPHNGSEEEDTFYQQITSILAPRYERYLRRSMSDSGHIFIHQPSLTSMNLFCTQVGPLTYAQSCHADISQNMHTIFLERAKTPEEIDNAIVLLAHEMGHRAREHVLCSYYAEESREEAAERSRNNEREADRISLLVLRDERYIKAFIKNFSREIDDPYIMDPAGGYYEIHLNETATHPSHLERIANCLDFWIEFVAKRDDVSFAEAQAYVQKEYSCFLDTLQLQSQTKDSLANLVYEIV